MTKFAPVPTEYFGVRFDSKSEAVFARLLDLCGIDWEHVHPISHCGHDWDFLVWPNTGISTFVASSIGWKEDQSGPRDGAVIDYFHRMRLAPMLIELKPSAPTDAYLQRLSKDFTGRSPEMRFVVWGNPFGEPITPKIDWYEHFYYCTHLLLDGTWTEPKPLSIESNLQINDSKILVPLARSYRFDLEDPEQ